MRNLFVMALAFVGVLTMSGCTDSSGTGTGPVNPLTSPNVQRSTINGAGQLATAMLLDNQDAANLATVEQELTGCLNNAETTLTGDVQIDSIGAVLATVITNPQYSAYISQAVVLASGQHLPTDKLGAENLAKIKEFFDGSLYRLARYDLTGHKDLKESPADLAEAMGIVPEFYIHKAAKKEMKSGCSGSGCKAK